MTRSSERDRRHARPIALHDLIPRSGGSGSLPRRHWIKFWLERWRSSPRVRATSYQQHGLYLTVLSYAGETEGELRMSDEELAIVAGVKRGDRMARFNADLKRLLDVGLLERGPNGRIKIPRFMESQEVR